MTRIQTTIVRLALAAGVLASSSVALAQAPAVLPIQGYLTDADDVAIDGAVTLDIAIYTADVGTTTVYGESQTVMVDRGSFSVYLGEGDTGGGPALDLAIFRDNSELWVGIAVDGAAELPRFLLGSVPYAGFAQYTDDAAQLGGRPATDYAIASDTQPLVTGTCAAGTFISAINSDGSVSCAADTDTDTTYTAGAGLSLAGTTFAVDSSTVQSRVTGTCAAGSSIRSISSTGAVTCEPDTDTDTTYAAGTGLTLDTTTSTFSANTSYLQRRVTGTCAAGSSIRTIAADGTVTCETDDSGGTYTGGTGIDVVGTTISIANDGVGTAQVANTSLTEADLDVQGMGVVSSTTNETVFARYINPSSTAGVTTGRIMIVNNGGTGRGITSPTGGGGTATVTLCSGTETVTLESGGGYPWTHITASTSWASSCFMRVDVSAASAASPVYLRTVQLLPGL